jgi:hypothetical protein
MRSLPLALTTLLVPAALRAQAAPATPVGHPARIAPLTALAEVRTFAVVRAGDRALVAYVEAGELRARGTLRLALLRAAGGGVLERVGTDRTLAPGASVVALAWDGARGAVAYVVPRPHRGQDAAARARHHRPEDTARALADPLGPSTLTAGDVMLQRVDGEGAPVGRPVPVFEENSRAFAVAVAFEGDGYRVAWSGGIVADDEVLGTVRTMHVTGTGVARAAASDTGFTGQVGGVLRVVPASPRHPSPWVLWTGERCAAREDLPPVPRPSTPTNVDHRPGAPPPPHVQGGRPIECGSRRLYAAELHADGTTGAVLAGPRVGGDAFALAPRGPEGPGALVPVAGGERPYLGLAPHPGSPSAPGAETPALVRAPAPSPAAPGASEVQPEGLPPASQITPSRVPPPGALAPEAIAATPLALDATGANDATWFLALSPERTRVIYGTRRGADFSLVPFAPGARTWEIALAGAAAGEPWIFARTGDPTAGPLVYVDGATAARTPTPPEAAWAGDERLRVFLLRARATRAAFTDLEGTFNALSARADAATNPSLPGLAASMRRLRSHWQGACEPLLERARWLVRHGVDAAVTDLARAQCEIPPEPAAPGTAPAPPAP